MNRREWLLGTIALGAMALPLHSLGQARKTSDKTWRVGIVFGGTTLTSKLLEDAFVAGMKDHGYEIGRSLVLDARYADGDPIRAQTLVAEVITLKPDVLIGTTTAIALAMKKGAGATPIVTGTTSDPVGDGLAQSLARPGGNVTGVALQLHELSAKHIEIMNELLPRMSRVAVLTDAAQPKNLSERYEAVASATAGARGLTLEVLRIDSPERMRQIFRTLEGNRPDALLINPAPRLNALRQDICQRAASIQLPMIGFIDEWARDGALASFGPSFTDAVRRTAYFVDRIFKGAKPGDLPMEQPTKFSLIVNAHTAKILGIGIPRSIRLRAELVIE